jgi:hypothetical protein
MYEIIPFESGYAIILKGRIVISCLPMEDADEVCRQLNAEQRESTCTVNR